MSEYFDLTDILDKEETETIYQRTLSDKEWDNICYNLKSKFWSKIRTEAKVVLKDAPDYFLRDR
jgi:hypothetical protein